MSSFVVAEIQRINFLKPVLFIVLLLASMHGIAQSGIEVYSRADMKEVQKKYGLNPKSSILSRLSVTPGDVITIFKEAGMDPTEHTMSREEIQVLADAISLLPPLHLRVMKQHLKSISFVDNMPNTAITTPVTSNERIKLFHITFRSGILHQTISDWASQKENTCYSKADSTISISIQAGLMKAINYVLLHEGTHVVDGALGLLGEDAVCARRNGFTTEFAKNIWDDINTIIWPFQDSLVWKNIFRSGGARFNSGDAALVYSGLSKTPFVSLYGTASWHEDLAELLTIYHLVKVQKQMFTVVVSKSGREIGRFEPLKSAPVQARFAQLAFFYRKSPRKIERPCN